jgi:glycosyltransferase involved in cell wall biosynthesis
LRTREHSERHVKPMSKKRVLIIYRSYFPSQSHLGPATAIRNLVEAMGADYDFHILTLNFDFATGSPLFPQRHHRVVLPHVVIEYVPQGLSALRILARRLRDNFDVIDIQCAFDPLLAIPALMLCRLGFAGDSRIFHTPHGIFMDIIMSARRTRKTLYCRLSDLLGLYRSVVHLAGSPGEKHDIDRNHLRSQQVVVVSQFVEPLPSSRAQGTKPRERLKVAFVGRVTAQKNLIAAIEILHRLRVPSTMDVFGDTADTAYLAQCMAMIRAGSGASTIDFKGNVDKNVLFRQLPDYDVLLHPTLGENFGHAIVEALHLGVPVLISDRSPWTDVESCHAGWSLPLSNPSAFVDKLEAIYAMGEEWSQLSAGAIQYARKTFDPSQTSQRYRDAYG